MQRCYGRHNLSRKSVLSILSHGVISLPDGTSYDKLVLIMISMHMSHQNLMSWPTFVIRKFFLTLWMLGNISCFCCLLTFFFKINFFKKYFRNTITLSECQTVWIQIKTNILSVMIWVQTVCKGYQQRTKVAASKKRVKQFSLLAAKTFSPLY